MFELLAEISLPLGSKPSNWLMSSSIVRWTSLSPPAPSSNLAPGGYLNVNKNSYNAQVWGSSG